MITLSNVSKVYEINGLNTIVLKDISFEVNSGDIFGIVGKTGSGKSTLLRLMNGFIKPDSGSIKYHNELLDINNKELIKETSMIFQSYNLLNNLNVLDNILLPIKIRKLDTKTYLENALNLLDFVGLKEYQNSFISTLSGGQKQRVAIARALITNPKVIFCDEPTSALDDQTSFEVLSLLKKINSKFNTTIILVSHNIDIINMMCNKIAIIENGVLSNLVNKIPTDLKFKSYEEVLLND